MTSPDTSDDVTNGPRITLSITGTDLPTEEADLESILIKLEIATSALLEDALGDSDIEIESWIGQFYTTVEPTCPACGNRLDLQSIYLVKGATAYSLAVCTADCGWSGDATFTVIDLDRRVGERSFESAVLAGQATATYRPYTDRES